MVLNFGTITMWTSFFMLVAFQLGMRLSSIEVKIEGNPAITVGDLPTGAGAVATVHRGTTTNIRIELAEGQRPADTEVHPASDGGSERSVEDDGLQAAPEEPDSRIRED